jgi:hypothetical protein
LAAGGILVTGITVLATGRAAARDGRAADEGILAGGLAGLGGVLVHSNFCIVLHVLPNAMMLGLLAALVLRGAGAAGVAPLGGWRAVPGRLAAALLGIGLLPLAWQGVQASRAMLPLDRAAANGRAAGSYEAVSAALQTALAAWPHVALHLQLGRVCHDFAMGGAGTEAARREAALRAVAEYGAALERDPTEPAAAVNRARALSLLEQDRESELGFALAGRLQCQLEDAFRACHFAAQHYYRKAWRCWLAGDHEATRVTLAEAHSWNDRSRALSRWGEGGPGGRELAAGMRAFTALVEADRVHREALEAFHGRQPEVALRGFLKTRELLNGCRGSPGWAGSAGLQERFEDNEKAIRFLEGAGIKPAP